MSPKEIAESFLESYNMYGFDFTFGYDNVEIIARAYLELEKEKARLILHIDDIEKANDNCQTKIANLELEISKHKEEITKLKKSREVLRKACEFYGDEFNWGWSDWSCDRINYNDVVTSPLEYDRVGGIKAREALKADDELMKG